MHLIISLLRECFVGEKWIAMLFEMLELKSQLHGVEWGVWDIYRGLPSDPRLLWSLHMCAIPRSTPSFFGTPNHILPVTVTPSQAKLTIFWVWGSGLGAGEAEQNAARDLSKWNGPLFSFFMSAQKFPKCLPQIYVFKKFPKPDNGLWFTYMDQVPISNRMSNLNYIQHSGMHDGR